MTKDLTVPELKDGKPPLEVDVTMEAIPEPQVTEGQAIEAFKRNGLVNVGPGTIGDLAAIGIYTKGVGTLRIQRGRAMVVQQILQESMQHIAKHMKSIVDDQNKKGKTNELVRIGGALASLAGRATESQRLSVEIETSELPPGAPLTDTPSNTASFQPRQKVQPAGTTTVNNFGPTQVLVQEKKPE